MQEIDYTYNERGWLRTALTPNNLLNIDLRYDTPNGGTPQYNGNISQMWYNTTQVTNPGQREFTYSYDPLNRLTNAQSNTGDMDEAIVYDEPGKGTFGMGNITTLNRTGLNAANLSFNYADANGNNSNQLQAVANSSNPYRNYVYDANGNATTDGNVSNPKTITYNLLNLPQTVTQNGAQLATYIYDATGTKLRNSTSGDGVWDYDGEIIYQNNAVRFIQTEEGRVDFNNGTYDYVYNLKDHLGNIRVSIDKYNNAARVIQEDEYYAFGLRKNEYAFSDAAKRYLYNGKELQTDLANQYDYGARFYDAVIGRWNVVDPLAEKDRRSSPYNYGLNNPIRMIDPDGMEAEDNGDPFKTDFLIFGQPGSDPERRTWGQDHNTDNGLGTKDNNENANCNSCELGKEAGSPNSNKNGGKTKAGSLIYQVDPAAVNANGQAIYGITYFQSFDISQYNYKSYMWISIVNSNPAAQLTVGMDSNKNPIIISLQNPIVDGNYDANGNNINYPYYNALRDNMQNGNFVAFGDEPHTSLTNYSFSANTSLIGIDGARTLHQILTVNWGYTVKNGVVSLSPTQPVQSTVAPATTQTIIDGQNNY